MPQNRGRNRFVLSFFVLGMVLPLVLMSYEAVHELGERATKCHLSVDLGNLAHMDIHARYGRHSDDHGRIAVGSRAKWTVVRRGCNHALVYSRTSEAIGEVRSKGLIERLGCRSPATVRQPSGVAQIVRSQSKRRNYFPSF
jgi:hypothetical protein